MICISIKENNFEKCLSLVEKAEMAEIRLDLTGFSVEQVSRVFSSRKKMIATCRPGKLDDRQRGDLLKAAIGAGASFVDLEYEASAAYREELMDYARHKECEVIISYHNFEFTPEIPELENIMYNCFKAGADVAKIATMIRMNRDNSKILSLYHLPGRLVAIGMGELGKISRIVAPFLGAEFTYAAPDGEEAVAPGQMGYSSLNNFIMEIQKI